MKTLKPLSESVKIDIECINNNLFAVLNLLPILCNETEQAIKDAIVDSLKKLPINNNTKISKYC
jgi:hypothetical protein